MDSNQVADIDYQLTHVMEANETGKGDGSHKVREYSLNRMIRQGIAEDI